MSFISPFTERNHSQRKQPNTRKGDDAATLIKQGQDPDYTEDRQLIQKLFQKLEPS